VRLFWSLAYLKHCIFSAPFPWSPHFLTTAVSVYLQQPLPEAFAFYSIFCCLSLPLLSASQCPLWLFLLYMMNVTPFALFSYFYRNKGAESGWLKPSKLRCFCSCCSPACFVNVARGKSLKVKAAGDCFNYLRGYCMATHWEMSGVPIKKIPSLWLC